MVSDQHVKATSGGWQGRSGVRDCSGESGDPEVGTDKQVNENPTAPLDHGRLKFQALTAFIGTYPAKMSDVLHSKRVCGGFQNQKER
jgi:hypothetical protein